MLEKLLQHCGLNPEIEKESFPENFFPVPSKYIVYQTGSEKKSQVYDHSSEVLSLIWDLLVKEGIEVIQVGDLDDPKIQSHIDLRGQISIRQLSYIIKHSILCVTSNRLSSKLCRVFNKDVILLGSNFPNKRVVTIFDKLTYIEPELNTEKWTYQEDENVKLINSIKPEEIGQAILRKVGINIEAKFETFYIGEKYGPQIIDLIPDGPIPEDLKNKTLNVRLDILFEPLSVGLLSNHLELFVTTKKGFDLREVNSKNIKSISYFVDKEVDIDFIKQCFKNKIQIFVISENKENLNDLRFKLLGICEVYKKIKQKPLDFFNKGGIMFKTSRFYVGRGKAYCSLYHYRKDLQTNLFASLLEDNLKEEEDFLESVESMYFFKI